MKRARAAVANALEEIVRVTDELMMLESTTLYCYLYAAFSIRGPFQELAGWGGSPGANSLFGIAVQEMQHMSALKRVRCIIGRPTRFEYPAFPIKGKYPFDLTLEHFSQQSALKYAFVEAPNSERARLCRAAEKTLPQLVDQSWSSFKVARSFPLLLEAFESFRDERFDRVRAHWQTKLQTARREGDRGHYSFFRALAFADHPVFTKRELHASWNHGDRARSLSIELMTADHDRLAKLMYWTTMLLMELSYRADNWSDEPDAHYDGGGSDLWFYSQARGVMRKVVLPYGQRLARSGLGYPFVPDIPFERDLEWNDQAKRDLAARIAQYSAEALALISTRPELESELDASAFEWLTPAVMSQHL